MATTTRPNAAFETALTFAISQEVVRKGAMAVWGDLVEALGYDRRHWARAAAQMRIEHPGTWWRYTPADRYVDPNWRVGTLPGSPRVRELLEREGITFDEQGRWQPEHRTTVTQLRRRLVAATR
jgi:hypothetical protein